jgi:hypothetical protein
VSDELFTLPGEVIAATLRHLRAKGAIGHEGVVLWRGTFEPPRITAAIVPAQETGPGRFVVPLAERQRIARSLSGTGEMIVAQVHSHPRAAFHSPTDDAEAIPRRVGAYSLVIPDYGRRADLLDGAALFQLAANGTWQETNVHTFKLAATRRRGALRWLIDTLKNFGRSRI